MAGVVCWWWWWVRIVLFIYCFAHHSTPLSCFHTDLGLDQLQFFIIFILSIFIYALFNVLFAHHSTSFPGLHTDMGTCGFHCKLHAAIGLVQPQTFCCIFLYLFIYYICPSLFAHHTLSLIVYRHGHLGIPPQVTRSHRPCPATNVLLYLYVFIYLLYLPFTLCSPHPFPNCMQTWALGDSTASYTQPSALSSHKRFVVFLCIYLFIIFALHSLLTTPFP